MTFDPREGFAKRPQGPLGKKAPPKADDGFTPLTPGEPKKKEPGFKPLLPTEPPRKDVFKVPVPGEPPKRDAVPADPPKKTRPDVFTVPVPADPPKTGRQKPPQGVLVTPPADPPKGISPAWMFGNIPLGGAPRRADAPRPRPEMQKPETDEDTAELLEYIEEVLSDYERHVKRIGELGFTAPMLLYYRDEIQETLEILEEEPEVDTQPYWRRVVEHDNLLKANKQALVDEIGHVNFKQYQIINDPPREHWWWFLNRETAGPPPPVPFWMFWKRNPDGQESHDGGA